MMKARNSLAAAALAAVVCAGASAFEQVDEQAAWERLHSGVTFAFDETPMAEAVQYFQSLGVNVVVQQEVLAKQGDKPVTMRLTNVRIRHALQAFAASLDLDCEVMEGAIVLMRRPPKNGGESAGKVTLKSGPQTLELDLRRGDMPSEARRHLMRRAVDVFRQEAEERARGAERRREQIEREDHRRREREEGERIERGRRQDRDGDGEPGKVF